MTTPLALSSEAYRRAEMCTVRRPSIRPSAYSGLTVCVAVWEQGCGCPLRADGVRSPCTWEETVGQPFLAYMLLCSDGSYYVGHTDDLPKRVTEHASGIGCVYTAKRLPVQLVWSQEFATRDEAKAAEARLKNWSRAKKQALIRGDFKAISALAKKKDWAGYKARRASDSSNPARPDHQPRPP